MEPGRRLSVRARSLGAAALILAAISAPASSGLAGPDRLNGLPRLMLWAWERPEDFRGLDLNAGVAYLAATYRLRGDDTDVSLRRQPLRVDSRTALMATVRIETDRIAPPPLSSRRAEHLATEIMRFRDIPGVRALQIDFDATSSERDFYRQLLTALRRRAGPTPISITALASWCAADRWIDDLPVDEAVPMLFRMGPGNEDFLDAGADNRLSALICRTAVGISTDEMTPRLAGHRRVYVFHPRSWTTASRIRAEKQVMR